MIILGVNSGIGASVCLLRDGRIVLALEEERLCRQKGFMGFPRQCVAYLLEHHRSEMENLAAMGLAGEIQGLFSKEEFLQRYEVRANDPKACSWLEKGRRGLRRGLKKALPAQVRERLRPGGPGESAEDILRTMFRQAGITPGPVREFNHHICHAGAVYHGLGRDPGRKYLIFTLDGGGDGECARVCVGQGGKIETLAVTESGNSIGNLYSNTTHLLGFTPHEHEYKLMGLAPYVPERHSTKARDIFRGYLALDPANPLCFKRLTPERTTWTEPRLARDLRRLRFDNVAAGLQRFTEELLLDWVRQAVRSTGIPDVLLSGGVFMNVKLNQYISWLDEVRSVNVFPSCGDESNSIGCAFLLHREMAPHIPLEFSAYTLGPTPAHDLEEARREYGHCCAFTPQEHPERAAAELIAQGNILARCSGPMEFGARALGNRSILCDSSNPEMVERVNFLIKQRDFWMPFAPAVRVEDARDYLVVPETLTAEISPYMMFTFDTTERRRELSACLQRADKTARAQIVCRDINPGFHELLTNYKDLTGRGVMMNTSFNIHGHPIVMGSMQALDILMHSNLDYLLLGNMIVSKK